MTARSTQIRVIERLDEIPAADWNRLDSTGNPFVRHEYLAGLERHDCLAQQGWLPRHLTVWQDNRLLAALPLYLRTNSYGEFVFDWAWADAYERAGGRYYPKLVTAIPFAPVTGPRLLVASDSPDRRQTEDRLVSGLKEMVQSHGYSSAHALFTRETDHPAFADQGFLRRWTCQFRWANQGYRDFQDFLDVLTSKRRKQIRRERREVASLGLEIEVLNGHEISPAQWRVYHEFYCSTFQRRWGNPRLTLDFFTALGKTMPDETLLILARDGSEYVAGAFAMIGGNVLYGRHWGCSREYPFLHFELCYYQTMDYCLQHGLGAVDAGVQGEHKIARGYAPVTGVSWHWIEHPGFRTAVAGFLERETAEMADYVHMLNDHLPYHQSTPTGDTDGS